MIPATESTAAGHKTQKKVAARPLPTTPGTHKKPAGTHDRVGISAEAREKGRGSARHLSALAENLRDDGPKTQAKDPAKAEKARPGEEKTPPVQQKIDKLQEELKKARESGDKDAIARLEAELKKLQEPKKEDGSAPGLEPESSSKAVDSGTSRGVAQGHPTRGHLSSGGAGNGSGASLGNGSSASGSGPSLGSGSSGGGTGPMGGANEAGAGQGAGAGKEEVDQFIQFAAQAYGANPRVLSEMARRESNFNTGDIANNWDSNAKKGTPSKGMFQFIQPTFQSMAPQAKAANPGAWAGVSESWTDWKAQALTTAWAITHGKGNQWSTYQASLQSGGGSSRMA